MDDLMRDNSTNHTMEDKVRPLSTLPRVNQAPEWEVPTNPPRHSCISRLLSGSAAAALLSRKPAHPPASPAAGPPLSSKNQTSGPSDTLPTHTRTTPFKSQTPTVGAYFDRIFSPNKKYFGRSRRLFLAIILASILLLGLILGLGLGLGLKDSRKSLPFPTSGHVYTGDLTYYDPGLGACGKVSGDNDAICAVAETVYDDAMVDKNPNNDPLCGRKIRIERGEVVVEVEVVDRCTGCDIYDLDLSPGIFTRLASRDLGRVQGHWTWV